MKKRNLLFCNLFTIIVVFCAGCGGKSDTSPSSSNDCLTCRQYNQSGQETKKETVCGASTQSDWIKNNSGNGYSASCGKKK